MKKTIKNNNKGFMLVEVIIVTVVIATIMTSLYVAFSRVYKVYDMKSKYSNIDGIYSLNIIKNYYIENIKINKMINDSSTYIDLKKDIENSNKYCSTLNINDENIDYCNKINSVIANYKINNLYIVNKDKLTDLKNISDTSKLKYEITNKSEKSSASIEIKCIPDKQEYTSISNVITSGLTTLDASDKLTGEATITLNKAVTLEATESYECKIIATRNEN